MQPGRSFAHTTKGSALPVHIYIKLRQKNICLSLISLCADIQVITGPGSDQCSSSLVVFQAQIMLLMLASWLHVSQQSFI